MNALIRARELAHSDPPNENTAVFRELLDSLERGQPVCLNKLYDLGYHDFELALNALKDWRLHRFGFVPETPPGH
jgi:hypothetical protein